MHALFDAHCHLQDERLAETLDAELRSADAAGVRHLVCCGTAPDDWDRVLELAGGHDAVIPSLGLHPGFIETAPDDWFERLKYLSEQHQTAVGEAGLDFSLKETDRKLQERIFLRQAELSRERNVPLSIHCRKAWERMPALLREQGPHPRGYVLHAYSGSADYVKPLSELNAYFSFGGTITRPNARRAPEALKRAPTDRLLIETDAPDMMPYGVNDEINRPQYLSVVCQRVAEILDMTESEVAQITHDNGRRVFGLR